MNDNLCFFINDKKIYLDQVLVEYMSVPIFFVCTDLEKKYLVLCTDIYELIYMVMEISLVDLYNLLHGNETMRSIILKQNEYWDVISGDDMYNDEVSLCEMKNVDCSALPEDDSYYEILSNDVEKYVENFDRELFRKKFEHMLKKKLLKDNGVQIYDSKNLYEDKYKSISKNNIDDHLNCCNNKWISYSKTSSIFAA